MAQKQNNMTWQSDEDFFEDISQLDDFRESIDPEMHSKQFIQYAEVRDERHEKQKKSFLEIDDDEDIPIVSYDTEPKSVLGISDDVGRQIEFIVGKKYNNDYLETKWNKQQIITEKNKPKGHSFVFQSNSHFKPLDPSDDFKPFVEHPPKKCTVASMIEKNINNLKSESPPPPSTSLVKKTPEIKKPEARVRFALPIMNGMKHYNGVDVKITSYEEAYGRSNGKWSSDWSDYSAESNSDKSSLGGCTEIFSNSNYINVNSKTDFPPL